MPKYRIEEATIVTTLALVEYAQELSYGDLPPVVTDKAKRIILDTIGCALAGSQTELVRAIDAVIGREGGNPICTLIGKAERNSPTWCAFRNAAAANALDFEDDDLYGHPASTIVPAALAVGEEMEASGQAIITAVVAAYDVTTRVGEAINPSFQRFGEVWGVGTHQVFGAAVAASRLMGLDGHDFLHAFGLAGVSAPLPSGLCWNFERRPLSWHKDAVHWPAWSGVSAARMAQAGFIGPRSVLDGPNGFWRMSGSDQFDPEILTAGLGTDFKILETSFKPYPACRWFHAALDAVGIILQRDPIDVNDIAAVELEASHLLEDYQFMDYAPTNLVDAEFSIPYTIAMALLRIPPGPDWFAEKRMVDPEVRRLCSLVKLRTTNEMNRIYQDEQLYAAKVIITTRGGACFSAMVPVARGSPSNPLPNRGLLAKFRRVSQTVLTAGQIEKLLARVVNLQDEDSLAPVCELLRAGGEGSRDLR